jgi:hypothetical protein
MAIKTFTTGEVLTASDTNTYLNNGGLVYISQVTQTSGTNLDITSCFSATYDAYKIVCTDLRLSAAALISATMLSGSTPAASNWTWASTRFDYTANAWNFAKGTADSFARGVGLGTVTTASGFTFDIINPWLSQYTIVQATATDPRGTSGYTIINTNGMLANTTSYNGIRLFVDSTPTYANMKATVYGYRIS